VGHSITYRIAVGPRVGRKVFRLQTLPACDPEEAFAMLHLFCLEVTVSRVVIGATTRTGGNHGYTFI
jgi:hypothetical protein